MRTILTVDVVLRPDENLPIDVAEQIANRAGAIFDSPPGETWVKMRAVDAFAENEADETHYPVLVSLMMTHIPPAADLAIYVQDLGYAVARVTNRRPEAIHIIVEPKGAGRFALGGQMA
ncbi:MAG: hypothetical protein GYB67_02380 [Chloroflexi bacterium]|nr:hypothetical protein [Chloroflexota bacterium]